MATPDGLKHLTLVVERLSVAGFQVKACRGQGNAGQALGEVAYEIHARPTANRLPAALLRAT